jgi:drug/metabolite transporter (DMT)-like permease
MTFLVVRYGIVLLLGEAMPPLAWVGLALAAAGVALASGLNGRPRLRR